MELRKLSAEGALVLLSSHKQMEVMAIRLESELAKLVLAQGTKSKVTILAEHRDRIDLE